MISCLDMCIHTNLRTYKPIFTYKQIQNMLFITWFIYYKYTYEYTYRMVCLLKKEQAAKMQILHVYIHIHKWTHNMYNYTHTHVLTFCIHTSACHKTHTYVITKIYTYMHKGEPADRRCIYFLQIHKRTHYNTHIHAHFNTHIHTNRFHNILYAHTHLW